jgi:hypothetical protein
MGKIASDATLLRSARADLNKTSAALKAAEQQRDQYRARATLAEQEVAAWKARFDLLLQKAGKMVPPNVH